MRAKKAFAAVICAGLVSALTPALASAGISLQFNGAGENAPLGGPVNSFSWGVSQPNSGAGGGATGRARYQLVTLTKPVDSSSPEYPYHLATGKRIARAQIFFDQPNSADGLALCMEGVNITKYDLSDTANPPEGPDDLTESLTLNYSKISYVIYLDGGPLTATFDLKRETVGLTSGNPCPSNT